MSRFQSIAWMSCLLATIASGQASYPTSLHDLIALLPTLVHEKRMDFPSYSDALVAAYKKTSPSLVSVIPLIRKDLEDSDPTVVFDSIVVLHGLAIESQNPRIILEVSDQLASVLNSGDEYSMNIAMVAVDDLGKDAPDRVLVPLAKIMADRDNSDRLSVGAAETLMLARPTDESTQALVLSAINDTQRPVGIRCRLLYAAANSEVGTAVTANVLATATSSTDKRLRDTAIHAAERIGARALLPIQVRLRAIADDPSESSASKATASHALRASAGQQ